MWSTLTVIFQCLGVIFQYLGVLIAALSTVVTCILILSVKEDSFDENYDSIMTIVRLHNF